MPTLPPRRLEALQLMAQGATIKQTAQKMTIAMQTVRHHRAQIYNAYNVDCPVLAVLEGIRRGDIEVEGIRRADEISSSRNNARTITTGPYIGPHIINGKHVYRVRAANLQGP